ncbi:uroporphyrinogen-III synthase [bacterium]|nr:uroporphyrinogen-III synthase [bacterium]
MHSYRVLVTGDRENWPEIQVGTPPCPVAWEAVSVLSYERLPVDSELLEQLANKPKDWIVFASPRAVAFWTETLLEAGYELPPETRVACIGQKTAEAAEQDGYTVDFCPREPGTEGFLEGFERHLSGGPSSFVLPAAEGGRSTLRDRLRQLGHEVHSLALYRTQAAEDLSDRLHSIDWSAAQAIVFTSPSSAEAVLARVDLPQDLQVVALGSFTGGFLQRQGFPRPKLLPDSDFARLGEVVS